MKLQLQELLRRASEGDLTQKRKLPRERSNGLGEPFGHGIHSCLGAPLSRMESRIALSDLLERAKGFELASEEPWEPRKALHVHGPARLPIRFEPGKRAGLLL
jgi:cytochrome P450